MRLIDADKLKQELKVNGLGYQYYMLDNAPTVEAIPIEWIREYICDLEVVISSMRKSHFPNEQAIYNQQFRVFQIKSLLDDWEKENEKSSNRD